MESASHGLLASWFALRWTASAQEHSDAFKRLVLQLLGKRRGPSNDDPPTVGLYPLGDPMDFVAAKSLAWTVQAELATTPPLHEHPGHYLDTVTAAEHQPQDTKPPAHTACWGLLCPPAAAAAANTTGVTAATLHAYCSSSTAAPLDHQESFAAAPDLTACRTAASAASTVWQLLLHCCQCCHSDHGHCWALGLVQCAELGCRWAGHLVCEWEPDLAVVELLGVVTLAGGSRHGGSLDDLWAGAAAAAAAAADQSARKDQQKE
jgi:hypothetical protein